MKTISRSVVARMRSKVYQPYGWKQSVFPSSFDCFTNVVAKATVPSAMTNLCSFVYRKFFSRIAIDGNSVCFPGIFCNKWLKHTFYIIVYKSVTLIIIHIIQFNNLWCDNYMIYSLFSVNMFRITVFNMDCGKMTVINMSIFSVYFQNSEICRICWLYVI